MWKPYVCTYNSVKIVAYLKLILLITLWTTTQPVQGSQWYWNTESQHRNVVGNRVHFNQYTLTYRFDDNNLCLNVMYWNHKVLSSYLMLLEFIAITSIPDEEWMNLSGKILIALKLMLCTVINVTQDWSSFLSSTAWWIISYLARVLRVWYIILNHMICDKQATWLLTHR